MQKTARSDRVRLAVVIVNYRTPELTVAAARSVLGELKALGGRCAIVDNNSQDGSTEILAPFACANAELVDFIPSLRNGGFAAGNNLGIGALRADYYLLLNSDAEAEPGALATMLEAAAAAPDAGIVTPSITDQGGRIQTSRFRRHSLLSEFVDGAQSGPITRLLPRGEVPIAPANWATPPDWVSFAAVLISRRAVEAAGPMDEGYFLYFEDCDYCLRIRRAGLTIALAPQARFRHSQGASTNFAEKCARLERLPSYYWRSRSRYFRKRYGPLGPMLANLAWHSGRAIAHARGFAGRQTPAVAVARARDMWIGWLG
jgi:hypothetical protein